jgi:hypothetical protein
VYERILAAAFRRDEAKALGGVEEFNGASNDSHESKVLFVDAAGAAKG